MFWARISGAYNVHKKRPQLQQSQCQTIWVGRWGSQSDVRTTQVLLWTRSHTKGEISSLCSFSFSVIVVPQGPLRVQNSELWAQILNLFLTEVPLRRERKTIPLKAG